MANFDSKTDPQTLDDIDEILISYGMEGLMASTIEVLCRNPELDVDGAVFVIKRGIKEAITKREVPRS